MAYEVVMPQLGLSMDKGQIIEWLKQPGDPIQKGDLLLVVETDKAALEVEAVQNGRLQILHTPEDGLASVGQVIAYLLTEDEQLPTGSNPVIPTETSTSPVLLSEETRAALHDKGSGLNYRPKDEEYTVDKNPRRLPSTPAARRLAVELALDWTKAIPTGKRGQVRKRDVEALASYAQASPQTSVNMTPVARRLAESLGLDLNLLAEMYPDLRIDRAEVEKTVRQLLKAAASSKTPQAPVLNGTEASASKNSSSHRRPASSLRMLIADRMLKSSNATAPVTLTSTADATELVKIREGIKADSPDQPAPGYNLLLATLVSKALLEHPGLNATLDGNEIVYWDTTNIGIAVNTERGLVVPVIRDVQAKSLPVLMEEGRDLLTRAADGKAMPDELSGGTFTITNLGAYEIDAFTPIINYPECAILGIGRLVPQVVPVEGQPVIRTMLAISLTFDHRLVDGAPAAAFLQRVKQLIEKPYLGLF